MKVAQDDKCKTTELTVVKSLGDAFDEAAKNEVKEFIEKLKHYKADCKSFTETFTIEFTETKIYRFDSH